MKVLRLSGVSCDRRLSMLAPRCSENLDSLQQNDEYGLAIQRTLHCSKRKDFACRILLLYYTPVCLSFQLGLRPRGTITEQKIGLQARGRVAKKGMLGSAWPLN